MTSTHAEASYRPYWIAWFILLIITVIMLFVGSTPVIITGISIKAAIICFWFMHLRYERLDFSLYILIGIFATGLILALLIHPDGWAR